MKDIENQKLFVLIGIPGSGKTTLAENMVDKLEDNTIHISRDAVRNEIGDVSYNHISESKVYKEYVRRIATSLKMGNDVIADATNLTKGKRVIYFSIVEALEKLNFANVDVIGIFVSTPLSECIERNSLRNEENFVPNETIEVMYSKIEEPSYAEGFKKILNKN